MREILCIVGLVALASTPACSRMDPDGGWVKPGPLTAVMPVSRPAAGSDTPATEQAAPPVLTGQLLSMEQAVGLALKHNAGLKAMARQVVAHEYRRLQAGRWSNPELEITAEDWLGSDAFSGVKQIQLTAQLRQELDLGGKRSARASVQTSMRNAAGWALELARLELQHRTRRAFIETLVAQQALALSEEEVALARQVSEVFGVQASAGRVAGLEEERARIAVDLARLDQESVQLRLASARQSLVACWGASRADFSAVQGDVQQSTFELPPKVMLASIESHPRLHMLREQVKVHEALVEAARAEGVPDLSLMLGYRYLHGSSDSAMVGGLGLPLPLFDHKQDAVAAALQERVAAEERMSAARAELSAALLRSAQRLSAASQAARVLDEQVLPQAKKTFGAIQEGARLGRFGYLELLEAQRTLFRIRRQALQARAEALRARIDLEYHLSTPLNSIGSE